VVGVVWKEAPESTTQSVGEGGEGTRCEESQGGASTGPLGGEGLNKVSITREEIVARGKTSNPGAWRLA
jgi:hypothetical protein